jgi:hypothetical protein
MRITKKWLRQVKIDLLATVDNVMRMQTDTLLAAAKSASGAPPPADERDQVCVVLKWAIHDAIPSHMCE